MIKLSGVSGVKQNNEHLNFKNWMDIGCIDGSKEVIKVIFKKCF